MDRRAFVSSVASGVLGIALAATAQTPASPKQPRRVLWLGVGAPDPPEQVKEYEAALAELGWFVGQNVLIHRRDVEFEALSSTAQEFVNAKVDLIVANGTAATLAAKKATTSIPVLMFAGDPVAAGLVENLARPGGNVTGIALLGSQLHVKRLSLLRELLPGIRRVGELDDSKNPALRIARGGLEDAYKSLGMEPIFIDIDPIHKFEAVVAEFVQRRAQALNVMHDATRVSWIPAIFGALVRASLPTMVDTSELLEAGALVAYSQDGNEVVRTAAVLFDKLLRGAKPADLPVVQPSKFSLEINLRTAKALGITIPRSLILRADRLIQ